MGFGFTSDTKIELRLRDALIKEKIPFQEQYRIYQKGALNPKYVVDFYIEFNQKDLIIECDGFSYHTSDFDIQRDIKREKWLKDNGYKNILRFTTAQILNEMHIVIRRIKEKLEIEKYSKQQLKFKGKQIRKDYVINVLEKSLHSVTLYYDYLQINEGVVVAYKFYDETRKVFSDIRMKRLYNVPHNKGGDMALLIALRALKSSTKLLVYSQTDFLVRYFNDYENLSIQQKGLEIILQELKKHNYLFKYINCRRNASYYDDVGDERLILQELKSKVRQHSYSTREDIGEIETIDYNAIF
ncbi:MAG: DUF559 domain-containing protein [Clostridia bacterium]|nr:DUF559 domain-containing protein [Clostridia bacterium]